MTTLAVTKSAPIATIETERRIFPITVDAYHLMAEIGAFKPTDRVELIEGELFEMSPIGSLHARCVGFLNRFLSSISTSDHIIFVQSPIILNDSSEPQPDLAVVLYRSDFYKDKLPRAEDVVVVFEVADTSARFDREVKLRKYASAGIPEAWLIDLTAKRIEIHTQPEPDGYGIVKIYKRGKNATSEAIPAIDLAVGDILG